MTTALVLASCQTAQPCTEGGDIAWEPPIVGDRYCQRKQNKSGNWINHGEFLIYRMDGKLAVEGQFKDGERHGIWTAYNEAGKKRKELYFEGGLEKPIPMPKAPQRKMPKKPRLKVVPPQLANQGAAASPVSGGGAAAIPSGPVPSASGPLAAPSQVQPTVNQ